MNMYVRCGPAKEVLKPRDFEFTYKRKTGSSESLQTLVRSYQQRRTNNTTDAHAYARITIYCDWKFLWLWADYNNLITFQTPTRKHCDQALRIVLDSLVIAQ